MTILKEYRINNNLGQKEMADKLDISIPAYANYENGKRIIPSEVLLKFLKVRNWDEDKPIVEVLEDIYGKL